mgnify:CR=1 FL=1
MSAVSDAQIFSMEVTRPAIENAVYVQKDAVHEKDGRYFVYTLDENGYRQAVWISVADQVGDYRIITEGLKAGMRWFCSEDQKHFINKKTGSTGDMCIVCGRRLWKNDRKQYTRA